MTTSQTLRQAAGVLLAEADRIDGKIPNTQAMTTFAGRSVTVQEAYALLVAEWAERAKPHEWRDAGPGVPITMVGDNDDSIEMDDLLRAFGPFMTLAENANFGKLPDDAVVKDSTGKPFHRITIKRRAGLGRQAVGVLRDEVRAVWYSPWGQATRADPLNVNHLPKPEIVHMFFDKVYG